MKRCCLYHHDNFLQPTVKLRDLPHYIENNAISDDVLDAFYKDRGEFFLAFPKLIQKLDTKEHGPQLQATIT
jgi:hypothetical protein